MRKVDSRPGTRRSLLKGCREVTKLALFPGKSQGSARFGPLAHGRAKATPCSRPRAPNACACSRRGRRQGTRIRGKRLLGRVVSRYSKLRVSVPRFWPRRLAAATERETKTLSLTHRDPFADAAAPAGASAGSASSP